MHRDYVIRVLGPIDLLTPYGERSVGGLRMRAVLGALVISVAHAVPSDRLIDIVWGDSPPPTATITLQSYISRLRSLLGPDSIAHAEHSYELVAGHEIDALQFETLVVAAIDETHDLTGRKSLCREALSLWRGIPFGELADVDPFRLEALRLDELRLTAMELKLETELALGHSELLIGTLEAAVVEHPYRERLWYLLIHALAEADRRVDALRACARLRDILADVGLEPADRLQQREEEIASGAPHDPADDIVH